MPVFRVEKELAQVEATVIDRLGRQGRASTAADCKVRPGGEPMPVAGAAHLERRHPAGYSAGSCSNASAAIRQRRSAAAAAATGAGHRAAMEGDSLK